MEILLNEYKVTRNEIRNLLKSAKETPIKDINEKHKLYIKSLSEIVSDLNYSIEWMETGKRPGLKRGIERRATYQREKAMDPLLMQKYFQSGETKYGWDIEKKYDAITSWDKERIEDALSVLTEREKEIYLMSRGQCFSYKKIAKYLKVSKSTVQKSIERGERKISTKRNQNCIFKH